MPVVARPLKLKTDQPVGLDEIGYPLLEETKDLSGPSGVVPNGWSEKKAFACFHS